MDINALMNMAKNVQERMQEAQAEASKVRVEGDAGGGGQGDLGWEVPSSEGRHRSKAHW